MRKFIEFGLLTVIGLLLVGAWLVEPFEVVSGSMAPTLLGPHRALDCPGCGRRTVLDAHAPPMAGRRVSCPHCAAVGPLEEELPIARGDRLLVDRRAFFLRPPGRWEVAAFRLPHAAGKIAVKRIVGLPGETLVIQNGEVYADGRHEPWPAALGGADDVRDPAPHPAGRPPFFLIDGQWTLGPDEYFVLGDNVVVSDDSRSWPQGPGVGAQLLIGKPFVVHLPDRVTTLGGMPIHVPRLPAIRYIR